MILPTSERMPPALKRYSITLLASLLALLGALVLFEVGVPYFFHLFLAAVVVSAWYGGIGPALLSVAFSALSSTYFLMPPYFSLVLSISTGVSLALFLIVAILISALVESRRRSESLLRTQREQYAITINSIGDAVIITDNAAQITLMNPIAEQITGWITPEAFGKPISEVFRIVNESTRQPVEDPVARTLREGRVVGLANHTVLIARDGTEYPIDDSGAPVRTSEGVIVGAVLVFRDISKRRRTEQEREQALEREQLARAAAEAAERRSAFLAHADVMLSSSLVYQEVLQALADVCVPQIADLCMVFLQENGEMIRRVASAHVDPASAQALHMIQNQPVNPDGLHPAAIAIRTRMPMIDPPIPEQVLNEIATETLEQQALRRLIPRSHIVVPLIAHDVVLGALSLGITNSTRIYTTADLQMASDLAQHVALALDNARLYESVQDALKARDAFLSLAAHELRTPLTSMLGNAELLQRRVTRANLLSERENRVLHVIVEQTSRLTALIDGVLDVSRLESGQLNIVRAEVDLCDLARRVTDGNKAALDLHTLMCEAPELAVIVDGDALRLEQVLQNLIQNAVKYSPDGGMITVRVERQGDRASFMVLDHGIGIPVHALPRLFKRFFRADNVSKWQIGGMGIGLYVVQEVVALHGGMVEVQSIEGQGSVFTVWLPLKVEKVAVEV